METVAVKMIASNQKDTMLATRFPDFDNGPNCKERGFGVSEFPVFGLRKPCSAASIFQYRLLKCRTFECLIALGKRIQDDQKASTKCNQDVLPRRLHIHLPRPEYTVTH